jgi:poly-gamma-glutamate synthesis protein (capsule biosynthesis protein)
VQAASAWGLPAANSPESAALSLQPLAPDAESSAPQSLVIYALAAAFPTVSDGTTLAAVEAAWAGSGPSLVMTESTRQALTGLWGEPGPGAVRSVPPEALTDGLWQDRAAWGIVPFDELNPRLKVLSVEGQSPLHKEFDPDSYPFKVAFALDGEPGTSTLELPSTNRDPEKMTVLAMTGVTALVRATAFQMEQNGVLYPGQDIGAWLREADVAHISNEVSFAEDCPYPDPNTGSMIFCSNPAYMALLTDIGTDVVELTGNHLNDYGTRPFLYTLDLYRQNNIPYYAGGVDAAEAQRALTLEDHGNKLAFLGCNPAGPSGVWATDTTPGAAYCGDYQWMKDSLASLRAQGYITIATQQYNEYYQFPPSETQARDFGRLAEAGASIVSGSQAHYPQTFLFQGDSFIHYGLGNLFFDQMDIPVPGTRREFIDRYVIYDGRLLSAELLTAMLEDWSRPRPMTLEERASFLQEIFAASGW